MFFVSAGIAYAIGRSLARLERHISDVTEVKFIATFVKSMCFLIGFVLFAHAVPQLRSLGNALLAGVSVISIVIGVAAQSSLSNWIAGFSLVASKAIKIGESVKLDTQAGSVTGRVRSISLSYSYLVDANGQEITVPNSVFMGSVITRLEPVKSE